MLYNCKISRENMRFQAIFFSILIAKLLHSSAKKCRAHYIGPLVINKTLDETHYVLSDLQGRVLIVNRLKAVNVRTPTGTASTYDQLRDAFTHITNQEMDQDTSKSLPDIAPAAILQSVYTNPYNHRCSTRSLCTCILDVLPAY